MIDGESIDDMLTRFTTISSRLISLGKSIFNGQKVQKIIRALSKFWGVKIITLKELNVEEMNFIRFMGNLKTTHEMEMKIREDHELQKKISVAFKASPRKHKKNSFAHQLSQRMMIKRKMMKMKISQSL